MGYKVKRENGVFRGWESTGSKSASSAKAFSSPSNSYAPSDKTGGKPYSKVKVSVKAKPRKNGVAQGFNVNMSRTGSKTKAPKAVQSAAKRAITVRSPSEPKQAKRTSDIAERIRTRNFKGKYFGPDEFKGDQAKIRAWKRSGKPRNSDGSPKV